VWTQQGTKLVGSGAVGAAQQGVCVALSGDGDTAIVGGYFDNSQAGAAWVWTRSGGVWTQQGAKLVGSGAVGSAQQGRSVTLTSDGNKAIVGGRFDNGQVGAAWAWTRSGGVWTQQGTKLVGSNAVGTSEEGDAASLSSDGNTAIIGGTTDNSSAGAAWVFAVTASPTVVTGVASGITQTGATLNATANPNGVATTGNFVYGLTTGYGSTTPAQSLGSGNQAVAIGGGGITALGCGKLYHFRATAANALGTANGLDATFTTAACVFTDDPLAAGATAIKAAHINELRDRIDALRVQFGLAAFSWTDSPLVVGTTTANAVHVTELRAALQQAYVAAGLAGPTFTDPTIVAGTTLIKVVHIKELRDAVSALEGS
jgi:antibiotic biosynthesis monooxygenase (ABM) superfamily enzyme